MIYREVALFITLLFHLFQAPKQSRMNGINVSNVPYDLSICNCVSNVPQNLQHENNLSVYFRKIHCYVLHSIIQMFMLGLFSLCSTLELKLCNTKVNISSNYLHYVHSMFETFNFNGKEVVIISQRKESKKIPLTCKISHMANLSVTLYLQLKRLLITCILNEL